MKYLLKAIIVLVPILIVIALMPIMVSLAIMILTHEKGPPVPTDAEMIEHFKSNEKLFEELRLVIRKDSTDRELEYNSLMEKIQIIRFRGTNLFIYFEKGDATWGIEKGFEYVFDRMNEKDKEFTEKELYDFAIEKQENCDIYKKINDNWNLFIMYDR